MPEREIFASGNAALPFLARRGLLIVTCTALCGLSALLFAGDNAKTYSATAYLLVPSVTTQADSSATNAYDAQRLADNFAVVMSQDQAFLDSISSRSGIAVDEIQEGFEAVTVEGSSVLRVTWSGDADNKVGDFFRSLAETISLDPSSTPAIPPNSLSVINAPSEIESQNNINSLAVPVALILGLLFGVTGSVLLERASPRIDSPENAVDLLGLATVDMNVLSKGGVSALVAEMRRENETSPLRLAVIALPSVPDDVTANVTARLEAVTGIRSDTTVPGDQLRTVAAIEGGRLDGTGEAERVAQMTDASVLVFEFGARASDVVAAVERLRQFDNTPDWLLGVSSRRGLSKITKKDVQSGAVDVTAAGPASRTVSV